MSTRSVIRLLCTALTLLTTCSAARAEQVINTRFINDAASGREVMKAQATFSRYGDELRKVLLSFRGYADLHPWITETEISNSPVEGTSQVLIRFKFPWPVGKRWSRIEVNTDGQDVIAWRQIEGTLNANEGRLQFATNGQNVRIDYSAVLSTGFPDRWARGYKKQFVTEFINAAHLRAAETGPGTLRLADSTPNE